MYILKEVNVPSSIKYYYYYYNTYACLFLSLNLRKMVYTNNGRSKWDQEPLRYEGLHTRCKFCLATPFHPELTNLAGTSTLTSHPHNRSYMNMTAVQTKVVSSWNNMADILHHQILDLVRKRSNDTLLMRLGVTSSTRPMFTGRLEARYRCRHAGEETTELNRVAIVRMIHHDDRPW